MVEFVKNLVTKLVKLTFFIVAGRLFDDVVFALARPQNDFVAQIFGEELSIRQSARFDARLAHTLAQPQIRAGQLFDVRQTVITVVRNGEGIDDFSVEDDQVGHEGISFVDFEAEHQSRKTVYVHPRRRIVFLREDGDAAIVRGHFEVVSQANFLEEDLQVLG